MNKKEVFESFKSRIEEIVNHYDEVEEIKFYALLKNGTRFNFDFDIARFEMAKKKEVNSVVNGVCDIIAALATIAMLAISTIQNSLSTQMILETLTYSFFILFSVMSSIYHLFSVNHQRTSRVLLLVRQFILNVTIFLLTATLVKATSNSMFLTLTFLLLSVLSLFLSLLATKGGLKAGNIIISIIGLVLVFSNQDLYIVYISLSLIINGLLNAIFDSDKTKIAGTIKTTSLFYLLSILFFFLFFEHLLIAL